MEFMFPTVPVTVALAAVAVIGYLFGRRTRPDIVQSTIKARREVRRAKVVANELEVIAEELRRGLASHHGSVARFKERVASLGGSKSEPAWAELCEEAEAILKPTMVLATQIAQAYDQIRQQTGHLMTFTEVRTDPLTGLSNRRAMDESLDLMFAMFQRYQREFSIAIFDIDHFKAINDKQGHLDGDRMLREVAHAIDDTARETDIVARYGGEEFVVIMPHTALEGAIVFSDRVRVAVALRVRLTISGGVAEALDGDDAQSILSRADTALYGAKAGGRNRIYYHNGEEVLALAEVDELAEVDSLADSAAE